MLLFVLVVLFMGNTLFPPQGQILDGGDLRDQFYYWKYYYAENLRHGVIPFWNPHTFSGMPFLSHPSVAPLYPFNILFIILPLSNAFSAFFFIHLLLAAYGMYHLIRKTAGGDGISGVAGGVIYAMSGFIAARISSGHVDIVSTVAWIPWVADAFWSLLKHTDRVRIIKAVTFLTLQILAGYQFAVVITLELAGIYTATCTVQSFFRGKAVNGLKKGGAVFAAVLLAYALSSVQVLPTIELVKHSIRAGGLDYGAASWGSLTAENFILLIKPYFYGYPFWPGYSYSGPGPNYFEVLYYPSAVAAGLLVLGLLFQIVRIIRGRKPEALFFLNLIAIVFFCILAMGRNVPIHKIVFDLIPPYRLFRFPCQHMMMVVFLIAANAGLAMGKIRFSPLKVIILAAVTAELFSFSRPFIKLAQVPTDGFDQTLVNILTKDRDGFRILPAVRVISNVRRDLDFEAATYYGLHSTGGYNPIILKNYYDFIDRLNKNPHSSVPFINVEVPPPNAWFPYIDYLNVKYVLMDSSADMIGRDYEGKYRTVWNGKFHNMYENLKALPRYRLVGKAEGYTEEKEIEDLIVSEKADFSSTVYIPRNETAGISELDNGCAVTGGKIEPVSIISNSANRTVLETDASCNTILSTSEVYYPGWKALVDGKPVPILHSNMAFRALYIPKGKHRVEMYYFPGIYILGGGISIGAFIVLVYIWRRKA